MYVYRVQYLTTPKSTVGIEKLFSTNFVPILSQRFLALLIWIMYLVIVYISFDCTEMQQTWLSSKGYNIP